MRRYFLWQFAILLRFCLLVLLTGCPLLFGFGRADAFSLPTEAGPAPDATVTLSVQGSPRWADDGSLAVDLAIRMETTQAPQVVEMRLVPMAINGSIDFEQVVIAVPPRKGKYGLRTIKGFWSEPGLELSPGKPVDLACTLRLPAGSNADGIGIQAMALLFGQSPEGRKWTAQNTLLLKQPGTPATPVSR